MVTALFDEHDVVAGLCQLRADDRAARARTDDHDVGLELYEFFVIFVI
jgi:hypothetical protein